MSEDPEKKVFFKVDHVDVDGGVDGDPVPGVLCCVGVVCCVGVDVPSA